MKPLGIGGMKRQYRDTIWLQTVSLIYTCFTEVLLSLHAGSYGIEFRTASLGRLSRSRAISTFRYISGPSERFKQS